LLLGFRPLSGRLLSLLWGFPLSGWFRHDGDDPIDRLKSTPFLVVL
jgi:hypothetical protein